MESRGEVERLLRVAVLGGELQVQTGLAQGDGEAEEEVLVPGRALGQTESEALPLLTGAGHLPHRAPGKPVLRALAPGPEGWPADGDPASDGFTAVQDSSGTEEYQLLALHSPAGDGRPELVNPAAAAD